MRRRHDVIIARLEARLFRQKANKCRAAGVCSHVYFNLQNASQN